MSQAKSLFFKLSRILVIAAVVSVVLYLLMFDPSDSAKAESHSSFQLQILEEPTSSPLPPVIDPDDLDNLDEDSPPGDENFLESQDSDPGHDTPSLEETSGFLDNVGQQLEALRTQYLEVLPCPMPAQLRRFDLNGDCIIDYRDTIIAQGLTGYIPSPQLVDFREVVFPAIYYWAESRAQNAVNSCDLNLDNRCDTVDLSILLYFIHTESN